MERKRIKGHGEVAIVRYEDWDEDGLVCEGVSIESEMKGTLIKAEKRNILNS